MGPLGDLFLNPIGLLGLLALVPLIIVYLLRPDPRRLAVPTYRFLLEDAGNEGQSSTLRRLRRSLLFLLQLMVLTMLALSMASPYIQTSQATQEGSTILVVDNSASMSVQSGGDTRFDRALATARDDLAQRTTVITSAPSPETRVEGANPERVRETIRSVEMTDASGDLRGAVARASTRAGDNTRIVVISDFADTSGWRGAVSAARGRGQTVELRQFAGGGSNNVGIVDLEYDATEATVAIKNTGQESATREVSFAGETRTVRLDPGDIAFRTFPLPADGGTFQLSPSDSFPTDDEAVVVTPSSRTTDVLLLTNGGNENLRTALRVLPGVSLTVKRPPTAISQEYDVIVFGDVDADELLDGTVQAASETLANGGGVVIQAQSDLARLGLGEFSPVQPGTIGNTSGSDVTVVSDRRLVDGITFPPPDKRMAVSLTSGQSLVNTSDSTPLLALARAGEGRVLYYGYLPSETSFSFAARYPVFWKRTIATISGRPRPSELNRQTGERVEFETEQVQGPEGNLRGPAVSLDQVGLYTDGNRRVGANLLRAGESNVTAPNIESVTDPDGGGAQEQSPLNLTPLTAGLALLAFILEIGYMYYRGDL